MSAAGTVALRITDIQEEVTGVKTFFLAPVDRNTALPYAAGQFLTFLFRKGSFEYRRSYSISSSPATGGPLSITVKRIDNGLASRQLIDDSRVGDVLMTAGASGFFTLPSSLDGVREVCFFVAGIGITPAWSLIQEILVAYPTLRIVLFYSTRSIANTVFYKQLLALQEEFKGRLHIEWLFSTAKSLLRARLSKTLMPLLLSEHIIRPAEEVLFYTCGPLDYMRMVGYGLEEYGIPAVQLRREIFVPPPPRPVIPEDTAVHNIQLHFGGKYYRFTQQYPQTILRAAKKAGIILPYSCEAGSCGTCAARCTSGKVWLSDNEVLTDKELAEGLVLTCTGYALDSDIMLLV